MEIESYSFGSITVEGVAYTADVIIFPQRVFSPWWRRNGHSLHIDDLQEVLVEKPQHLIIGSGYYGVMKVPPELIDRLEQMGIETFVSKTTEAVNRFNEHEGSSVVAALHLTC